MGGIQSTTSDVDHIDTDNIPEEIQLITENTERTNINDNIIQSTVTDPQLEVDDTQKRYLVMRYATDYDLTAFSDFKDSVICASEKECVFETDLNEEHKSAFLMVTDTQGLRSNKCSLLINTSNINCSDKYGWTALMRFVRQAGSMSSNKILLKLLENGADPNFRNEEGGTALMIASALYTISSNIECMIILLEYGADVNLIDKNGNHALINTISHLNGAGYEACLLLIQYGADVNLIPNDGWSALTLASSYLCDYEQIHLVKLLLKYGAPINQDNNAGTPLICAVNYGGDPQAILFLIDRGANINAISGHMTALICAVYNDDKEMVELLLNQRADVNIVAKNETALIAAINQNNLEMVLLLIKHGADINLIVENNTPLIIAINRGDAEIVNQLLKEGAETNLKNHNIFPLTEALKARHVNHKIVADLLDYGAKIDSEPENPLMTIVRKCQTDDNLPIIELLLNRGASIDVKNSRGRSVLMEAIHWYSCSEAIILLLEHGANIGEMDEEGRYPLDIAVKIGLINKDEAQSLTERFAT